MSNDFDLEQQILKTWSITDDITLLADRLQTTPDSKVKEFAIANLDALRIVYELKFEQLWKTFEERTRKK